MVTHPRKLPAVLSVEELGVFKPDPMRLISLSYVGHPAGPMSTANPSASEIRAANSRLADLVRLPLRAFECG